MIDVRFAPLGDSAVMITLGDTIDESMRQASDGALSFALDDPTHPAEQGVRE